MGTVERPVGPNGEVPSPLRSFCVFVGKGRLGQRFDGGIEELVGLGVENQADTMNGLGGGEIGQVVAAVANLRECLLGRATDLELEDEDASKGVGHEVCAPLRLGVLGANKKPQIMQI